MIAEGWLGRLQRRRLRAAASSRARRRRGILPRPRPRVILGLLTALVMIAAAWMWLRDSSLVAVDHVSVAGAGGPDGAQIRSALVSAAHSMTTLDVRMDQLRTAVAPYPVVKDLSVSTNFPHTMKIRVIEQIPVGAVVVAGRTIAVAEDGTLLHDVVPSSALPSIPLRVPPGGKRLSDPQALRAVALLAAAPYQLLARISQVTTVAPHGLVAQVRNGPSIFFGDTGRLAEKWTAVAAVLSDPGSAGALYIDVTDPERPAAGASSAGLSNSGVGGTTSDAVASSPGDTTGSSSATAASPGSATAPSSSSPGG
jgi:cell division protein FtsQ